MASVILKGDGNQVNVTVYRITGRQLFFNVGRSVCEECDLTVAVVREVIAGIDGIPVRLKVEAWLNKLPVALSKGAYHPPVTVVDGRVIRQGVVPEAGEVRAAIFRAAKKRKEDR